MPKSVLFDREEVLKKVTHLFWQKGYEGTSMQDLVDATGLNRSSLYNSFGDKFHLYMESLNYYQCAQNDMMNGNCAAIESPKKALRALFESIKMGVLKNENQGCFLTNCTSELSSQKPEVKKFLINNKEDMITLFSKLIKKGQEKGEISVNKDPKHLALYLFSSLQGLRVTSMTMDNISDIEIVTSHIFDSL